MEEKGLRLYGTDWCLKSTRIRNYLQSIWVAFDDFNVETDKQAEAKVRSLYDGELKFPTVTYGKYFLKNPSIPELNDFLDMYNLRDDN
ncbi:hypothetical protein J8281_06525 [Aquimarina sp. U1-2]|uniref:glutaredoxin family protein n=1 Tax=Aquimarina sp. U1-2 TaxID=2823141 RepID=UPI001AECAC76|nr:glutaredoxin domain-containing protein [Aquimarina sp. U1-2]MBP2831840.1 hypothetical protein [Aquimarina sp. U1-2]